MTVVTESGAAKLAKAYEALLDALRAKAPELLPELRPPIDFPVEFSERAGAEQLLALWRLTSGQPRGASGAIGGLTLLGPNECQAERAKWTEFLDEGEGLDAYADLGWDVSTSAHPERVRDVYFAAGWIPVLAEPYEANYLAVDLAPLSKGVCGQIIVCGRDEDEKCVVAPDLASLLAMLAADCAAGEWEVSPTRSGAGEARTSRHRRGRLLDVLRDRASRD